MTHFLLTENSDTLVTEAGEGLAWETAFTGSAALTGAGPVAASARRIAVGGSSIVGAGVPAGLGRRIAVGAAAGASTGATLAAGALIAAASMIIAAAGAMGGLRRRLWEPQTPMADSWDLAAQSDAAWTEDEAAAPPWTEQ